jgi:hypothetical protein
VSLRGLLLGLLLATGVAAPAAAQRQSRRGFWMDGSVGYGRVRVVCLHCLNDRGANGTAVALSIGGTVSRYVLLGVEAQVWNGLEAGLPERVRSLNMVAQWYPWGQHNGLFVRGGTGLVDGTVIASDSSGQQVTVQGTGVGIYVAAGYDLLISRRLAFTFQLGDQISALGDLVAIGGVAADDTIAYLSRFSLGVTLR